MFDVFGHNYLMNTFDLRAATPQPQNGCTATAGKSQYFEITTSKNYPLGLDVRVANSMFIAYMEIVITSVDGSFRKIYSTTVPPEAGSVNSAPGYQSQLSAQ